MKENNNDSFHNLARYIGERVRSRRQRLGLSLREVAENAGITPTLLGSIERGTTDVRVSTLEKVQNTLGLELFIVTAGKYKEIPVLDEQSLRNVSLHGLVDGRNIFGEKVKGLPDESCGNKS